MPNYTRSSTATKNSKKKHHRTTKTYSCGICHKRYAQQQGVTRHQREAHEVSFCPICNVFKWSRHCQLKKHLKEQHTDVDLDNTLFDTVRSRRKATKNKKHLLQQHANKYDRKSHCEPVLHLPIHTVPTVTKDSHVSPPDTSPTYVPGPHADKLVTSFKREDTQEFDHYGPTADTPSSSSSTEEPPQPVDDVDMTVPHEQFWSSRAHMSGSTPVSDPFNFVILTEPISILYSPSHVTIYGQGADLTANWIVRRA